MFSRVAPSLSFLLVATSRTFKRTGTNTWMESSPTSHLVIQDSDQQHPWSTVLETLSGYDLHGSVGCGGNALLHVATFGLESRQKTPSQKNQTWTALGENQEAIWSQNFLNSCSTHCLRSPQSHHSTNFWFCLKAWQCCAASQAHFWITEKTTKESLCCFNSFNGLISDNSWEVAHSYFWTWRSSHLLF